LRPLDAVRDAERQLRVAGVPDARTDAELLVAHVLGAPRSALHARSGYLDPAQLAALRTLVERRRAREPLQHILGHWGFRRLTLGVDGRALVPRPETEVVVERCIALLARVDAPRVLDVGTGSGAIALALADERPDAHIVGVEVSPPALALARENAERTGLAERVELLEGDVLGTADGPFDLVVSNPPYIPEERLASLEPEVRDHDPREALVASGLTEAVARGAPDVLSPDGWLVLEVGDGQAHDVAELLRALGYHDVRVTPDLAGIPRVVEGRP